MRNTFLHERWAFSKETDKIIFESNKMLDSYGPNLQAHCKFGHSSLVLQEK